MLHIDFDGDGEITFQEFELFWAGIEAEILVSDMDQEDVFEALAEVGIEIRAGASFKAMKAALITHHNGRAMSAKEVFRCIDTDRSRTLNVKEVDRASSILGASISC